MGYSAGAASAVGGSGLYIYRGMHGGRERRESREGGKGREGGTMSLNHDGNGG